MDMNNLYQELTENINSLQSLREAAFIISSLKSLVPLICPAIINDKMKGISVSREGLNTFVGLLNSSEYLKGYRTISNPFSGGCSLYEYDNYYLTLGPGIVVELRFCESKTTHSDGKSSKEYGFTIQSYVDSQDLSIKAHSLSGRPKIEILRQDGYSVFDFNTSDEFLSFNGQKLNEALVPISPDNLANRFVEMMHKLEEKDMKQQFNKRVK